MNGDKHFLFRFIPTNLRLFGVDPVPDAVILILSLVGWPGFGLVIRGMVESIRREDCVTAARAMGLGHTRIIGRRVLPNTLSYVIVATTLRIPSYILGELALSLLGLGIVEPTPSWGNMLQKI